MLRRGRGFPEKLLDILNYILIILDIYINYLMDFLEIADTSTTNVATLPAARVRPSQAPQHAVGINSLT